LHFSHARVPFHLYVPVPVFDASKRLCAANQREGRRNLDLSPGGGRVRSGAHVPRPVGVALVRVVRVGRSRAEDQRQAEAGGSRRKARDDARREARGEAGSETRAEACRQAGAQAPSRGEEAGASGSETGQEAGQAAEVQGALEVARPFIRFSRDKRGYDTTVVAHAYRSTSGAQRGRVLYLFRTPSNLKVGRRPLDEEVTEALQHTHPDLTFDWQALQREIGNEQRPDYRDREHSRRPPPRRPDRQERHERSDRPDRQDSRPAPRPAPPPPPPPAQVAPPPVVLEDHSPLGRAVGAQTAARLRGRFGDLMQRIARRARSPRSATSCSSVPRV